MTAFDNIKTNNWPSESNDFEDFLVLELPLNDDAALTSSRRDIVVGSKVLHPKRTLTNSSAFADTDVGAKWDASTTGSPFNGSWDVVFDGNATANSNTQGGSYWHYTYESTTSITLRESISGQIEILAGRPGSNDSGTHSITLQSGGSDVHTVTLGTNGASGYQWFDFGTRSNIDKFVIEGGDPGVAIWAVRLDNVLLVNPTGGTKKFYDSNATFGSSKYISIPQDSQFDLGTEPFTLECYLKTSDASTGYPIIIGRWGSGGDSNFNNKWDWRPRANDNGGRWCFRVPDVSGGASGIIDGGATVTDGAWHHIAVSRSGSTWRMFTDGQLTKTVTNSNPIPALDGPLNLARGYNTYTGAIQDLRFYKGVAKYTENFTPPGAILG